MSNRPTIASIRASITTHGVRLASASDIDAMIARAVGKGASQPADILAFHAILASTLRDLPTDRHVAGNVSPTGRITFTYDWVTANADHWVDIPLALVTAGVSITNLANTYTLPMREEKRITPACHMGTVGRIGWVTSKDAPVRFFRREDHPELAASRWA